MERQRKERKGKEVRKEQGKGERIRRCLVNEKDEGKTASAPVPPTPPQDFLPAPLSVYPTPTHPLLLPHLSVVVAILVSLPLSSG